jgi:hypothetical protein
LGAVVIGRGCYGRAHGGCTSSCGTDAPAATTIAAAIRAAVINTGRVHADSANTAPAGAASKRESVGRNAGDAKDSSGSYGSDGSI